MTEQSSGDAEQHALLLSTLEKQLQETANQLLEIKRYKLVKQLETKETLKANSQQLLQMEAQAN